MPPSSFLDKHLRKSTERKLLKAGKRQGHVGTGTEMERQLRIEFDVSDDDV
jgi:hypothetical protein